MGTGRSAPHYRLLSQRTATLTVPYLEEDDPNRYRLSNTTNSLFSRNDCKLAKGVKELTLRGNFSYTGPPGHYITSTPFLQSGGFKAMQLEMLIVDLFWMDWNLDVLTDMWVANLKVLKLPICQASDYNRLGKALATMPRLVSLTITDLPDREEFISELGCLGTGIMACASTLRELDLEMTNFNRPCSWGGNERFIEPEENGFFFSRLFPCPSAEHSAEEYKASRKCHSRSGPDLTVFPRLGLTKLRLKHMSLPWYSFALIVDATKIKSLELPSSMVDDFVWETLKLDAQLHSLTEISSDMLSEIFLAFLGGQSSLQELSFTRPQDRYTGWLVAFSDFETAMTYTLSREAPRLGPDAGAGYPSLDFLSSLEGMAMLKHLVLPTDMYTSPDLASIAASLIHLENVEIG